MVDSELFRLEIGDFEIQRDKFKAVIFPNFVFQLNLVVIQVVK